MEDQSPGAAAAGSISIGAYSLEVGGLGWFARFEPEEERKNARQLAVALEQEPDERPAVVAAVEDFQESAESVTSRIEQADKLLRDAAADKLLDLGNISGEVDILLDLCARLDREGRFEEELRLMRSLNGLLALSLRWLDLIRSLWSLLRSAEAAGHVPAQAFAHHELGSLNLCAGKPQEAEQHLREAHRLQGQIGDLAGQCATRHNLDAARRDASGRGPWPGPPHRLRAALVAAAVALLAGGAGTALGVAVSDGSSGTETSSTHSAPVQHVLTVKLAGKGSGSVTGSGTTCRVGCNISVEDGHTVTLRAKEAPGSVFAGWKGVDCLRRTCVVGVSGDRIVVALFQLRAVLDTEAPTAPSDLRARAVTDSEIDLSWTASADNVGVTGYVIYRNGKELVRLHGTATTFENTGLAPSTGYVYTVRATDAAGNLSNYSNKTKAETKASVPTDLEPPTQPTNVSPKAVSASEIDITWSASSDNVAVSSYAVYRDGETIATIPATETGYNDTGLETNTTYTYLVVAYDAAGNASPKSDPVQGTTWD